MFGCLETIVFNQKFLNRPNVLISLNYFDLCYYVELHKHAHKRRGTSPRSSFVEKKDI